VVLGANNSSHDICADLWENGADVTMVQRSSTHIAPSESLMELALGGLYSEQAVANGITTDKADLIFASVPYKIMHTFHIPVYEEMKKRDAELYERLEKAGFLLDFGDDGSGLFMKYLRRGSGYYIDVGASELVANGSIKLKSRVDIRRIKAHSVELSDGTELPADLLVYATGYGSMNGWVAQLVSPEVAGQGGQVLGTGLGHHQGSRPVGRRAAQHVEADGAGKHVVPRRQSAPVTALFPLPVAAAESPHGRHSNPGIWPGGGASRALISIYINKTLVSFEKLMRTMACSSVKGEMPWRSRFISTATDRYRGNTHQRIDLQAGTAERRDDAPFPDAGNYYRACALTVFLAWNDVTQGWQTQQDRDRLAALAGAEGLPLPRSPQLAAPGKRHGWVRLDA
jgi:hypothetical protein